MYLKVNTKFRRIVAISPNELVETKDTKVFNKPEITTMKIDYIKIIGSGETLDVVELSETEKEAVDNMAASRAAIRIEKQKNNLKEQLNKAFQIVSNKIALYPENEKVSWDKQLQEALAYQADNTAPTPIIDGISSQRTDLGDTNEERKAALVEHIIHNNTVWTALIGKLIGLRHVKEAEIDAETKPVPLNAMQEYIRDFDQLLNQTKTELGI